MRKKQARALAIAVVLACGGCVRNELDETANTDPPYENLNPRKELEQREQREQRQEAAHPGQQPASGQALQPGQASVRTVADITGNPNQLVGERVVVQGNVEEVYKGRGFRLDDDSPQRGGIDHDLVIVGAKGGSWSVDDGWDSTQVRVEGTIRRVSYADLEKDLGGTLEEDVREALKGKRLVLIAESVQRMEAAEAK